MAPPGGRGVCSECRPRGRARTWPPGRKSARRRSTGCRARLAVGVPRAEVRERIKGLAAGVPAWGAPLLEVEMACGGVAGVAHHADLVAGVDAVTDVVCRRRRHVHVAVVGAGRRAVDDEVVAGGRL